MTPTHRTSHKDLILWQKAMDLAVQIHQLARHLPKFETFGLASQIRRAAVSIPSIARRSCSELETQLTLTAQLGYAPQADIAPVLARCDEVGRLLNAVITALHRRLAEGSVLTANR